jgi:hypothetical protein
MKRLLLSLAIVIAAPLDAAALEPINLDIGAPPVVVIRHAMTQRESRLDRMYDAGVIGLGHDGMLYTHYEGHDLKLVQRQIAEKLIDAENNDRQGLIYAIAYSHEGRMARVDEVRELVVKRWHERWKSGWWLRDAQGNWSRKP